MRLGALLGPVADGAQARTLADQARRYAGAGFTSLWSAQAVGRGFMITDPFVALSVAATACEGVEIGTAVLQVPLYHPVDLAHRVLSLRQVCGDRLILGVGAGSTQQDFDAFGRDHAQRFRDFRVGVRALRELLATGKLGDADLSPWPAVRASTPMFLGSWGRGVARAAREYDGWIASGNYRTPDEVVQALGEYRAAGGGRAIVSTLQLRADTDLGKLKDMLQHFAGAGFDDAVVMFHPGAPAPEAIRALID